MGRVAFVVVLVMLSFALCGWLFFGAAPSAGPVPGELRVTTNPQDPAKLSNLILQNDSSKVLDSFSFQYSGKNGQMRLQAGIELQPKERQGVAQIPGGNKLTSVSVKVGDKTIEQPLDALLPAGGTLVIVLDDTGKISVLPEKPRSADTEPLREI